MGEIIAVKIGTEALTGNGETEKTIVLLAEDIAAVVRSGKKILIVTSGAVGEGEKELFGDFPVVAFGNMNQAIIRKQAQAAVGQGSLITAYKKAFARHGLIAAQVLLTQSDFADQQNSLNICATIQTLLLNNLIPVLNENDVVSNEELCRETKQGIVFSDNDSLASVVAIKLLLDGLVFLTDVKGVYENYPPRHGESPIAILHSIPYSLYSNSDNENKKGKGSMRSKVEAGIKVNSYGIPVYIVGWEPRVLSRLLLNNERIGTFLPPLPDKKGIICILNHTQLSSNSA